MFKKRTVLVVGAGANYEANMPLGAGLAEIIAGTANLREDHGQYLSGDQRAWTLTRRRFQDPEARHRHIVAARKIAEGIYGAGSIDNYIDMHSPDDAIATMGKLFISVALLRREQESLVYVDPSNIYNRLDLLAAKDTWLDPLRTVMFENVNAANLDDVGKNLTIISFNYDRVVEQYLAQALQRVFHLEPKDALDLVAKIEILRPYGSLGRLPIDPHHPNPGEVAFGADVDKLDCWLVADHIKTYSEQLEDAELTGKIENVMSSAEQLVFLGFGFHPQNMKILSVSHPNVMPVIYASGFGIYQQEHDELRRRIMALYPPGREGHSTRLKRVHIEIDSTAAKTLWMHRRNIT